MISSDLVQIHPSAEISPLADLEVSLRSTKIMIGEGCRVDSFVKIKPVGGCGDVVLGKRCYVNSGCVLFSGNGIIIGDDVLIAPNCTLAPVNHAYSARHRIIRDQGFGLNRGGIIIENDVWIGANCVILDGAVLRRGCVIGAGSLVRGELPEYSVCYGTPAVQVDMRK